MQLRIERVWEVAITAQLAYALTPAVRRRGVEGAAPYENVTNRAEIIG